MKKSMTLRPIHLCIFLAGCLGYSSAAPYPPEGRPITFTQPNGKKLKLRVFGDEHYARTETLDGHTVVYNAARNQYNYATVVADGSAFSAVGKAVGGPVPAGLTKHADLSVAKIGELERASRQRFDQGRTQRWDNQVKNYQAAKAAKAGPNANSQKAAAQVVGRKVGLTILVQFPNDPRTKGADPVNFPTNRAKAERYCNEPGYSDDGNSGSIRDYFYDQSLGKLTYTQSVTQIVTMPKPRNFYNFSDYPANNVPFLDVTEPVKLIIAEAVSRLKAANYDFTNLTVNANGEALATNIFFAGSDSGVFGRGLWPHNSRIPPVSVGTAARPVFLSNYQITNADSSALVIGTFCHENGHLLLGYPDIYANTGEGQGVGRHCLMGSGNYLNDSKTPAPINAYFKDIVGWANITEYETGNSRAVFLPTTGNVAYRLRKVGTPTENFIVENRGPGDKWAQFSPDKGIVIWHIDETIRGNYFYQLEPHYGISVIQADGDRDLELNQNRGDSDDYFDILSNGEFSDSTFPEASWYDATPSGLSLKVAGPVGVSTLVQFGQANPNQIIVTGPNGGERLFPATDFPITWDANIVGNVKIELFKDGVFVTNIATNAPNDGVYAWNIAALNQVGAGYSIRVSSITNLVASSDTTDGVFSITDGKFPVGDVFPYGWVKPPKAQSIWQITKTSALEGTFSMASGKTGDGKVSAVSYRSNFLGGSMSFYIKVSSEKNADFAHFSIDGVKQRLDSESTKAGISGATGWIYQTFTLPAGWHTLQWSYEKDDAYSALNDTVWIDGVTLPLGTQEIAVFNSSGQEVVDAAQTVSFPATSTSRISAPVTFTVKNVGVADLSGINVSFGGVNPTSYSVSKLTKTALAGGTDLTFDVSFAPKVLGPVTATMIVSSDDENERTTTVNLSGDAFGTGALKLNYVSGKKVGKSGTLVDFGSASAKSFKNRKTFLITNSGNAILSGLAIQKFGSNKSSFLVSEPASNELAPGTSATFTVTFSPNSQGKKKAGFRIVSSDPLAAVYKIRLTGRGTPKRGNKASALEKFVAAGMPSASASVPGSMSSVEVVSGQKYLSLTIPKSGTQPAPTLIEVSGDLLDWSSGSNHTTTLIDDSTTLKVRDNTPVTGNNKRYIRAK
jgi:M6 family metalloprotease-like protein